MQYFYINQNSLNPTLRVELVSDGKFEFLKTTAFNNAIQNANITFTMRDENDKLCISKAPCNLIVSDEKSCQDHYIIEYVWKSKDVAKKGQFFGRFEISFNNDIKEEGVDYPNGNLIVPIYEDLCIIVK